jgi:hypothetical protein
MSIKETIPLGVKIVSNGNELFWPHSHVPRVGEKIIMKTGDDHVVKNVKYSLVDHLHEFLAIVECERQNQ